MGYYFRTYETVLSKAENPTLVPIIPGRYLICKDTGDIFYDTNDGTRKHLTDIVDIETESARAELLAPLNKFYFVKETAHFGVTPMAHGLILRRIMTRNSCLQSCRLMVGLIEHKKLRYQGSAKIRMELSVSLKIFPLPH